MFTGIIQAVGRLASREHGDGGQRLHIATGALDLTGVRAGDSIAVAGACLTVTGMDGNAFSADVSQETLSVTTLGMLAVGAPVNLEKAAVLGAPLGGHLVSGHVDGVGRIVSHERSGASVMVTIEVPDTLLRYIARKGSVCVDGASLTVNAVDGPVFRLTLIPHTLEHTSLGQADVDDAVNIEVDMVARYIESLIS